MPFVTTEYMDQQATVGYKQAVSGVAGVLNAAKLILGTNVIEPSKTSVPGDITQSPDPNLAPASLTWGTANRDANGDIVTLSNQVLVQLSASVNNCVIRSYGLTDAGGTHLLLSGNTKVPINLPDNLAAYNVQLPFAPGNPQGKDLIITS